MGREMDHLYDVASSISPVVAKPEMAVNRNEFAGGWYMYEDNRFGLQMETIGSGTIDQETRSR